ncbi:MAG: hydrogenobyrinic acid a,c-diamide synthase (glutamine-hydrolyzing) [Nitrospinae bacterium]|nr:hydrogenobyrinic acid a,c-diamide synthase (glutamine-hydrolyzing) [Nitrospinota bacterium]
MPRVVVSATHKSAGKTTVASGLCAALAERGLAVQPFKKGPDYIDPMWLTAAAGRECRNLDNFMFGWDGLLASFGKHASGADISIIEGNKGLHDSVETDGEGSAANLARKLSAPVILVLDASGTTRGIAPLLLGYKMFEPDINIAGVVLNKVGNARHEAKLRAVIEKYCVVPILGALRKSAEMEILERHLGLIPVKEQESLINIISAIRMQVDYSVDVDKVAVIARTAPEMAVIETATSPLPAPRVRVGVVMDRAFTFYYPENMEALKMAGAELVPVNAVTDPHLPERLDGLYIGGGFPETLMDELEANRSLRAEVRDAIENGLPVHAECGGLIYLSRSVMFKGKRADMAGVLDCDVVIRQKPKGHGYMELEATGAGHWMREGNIRAHEFHYGEVVNLKNAAFAYRVARGAGINGKSDGIVYKNVIASFAHLHHLAWPRWAGDFVSYLEKVSFSKQPRGGVLNLKK